MATLKNCNKLVFIFLLFQVVFGLDSIDFNKTDGGMHPTEVEYVTDIIITADDAKKLEGLDVKGK